MKLRACWVGIAFALLPDLDWVERALFGSRLWTPGALHDATRSLFHLGPICAEIARLPDVRSRPLFSLPEIALSLAAAIYVSRRRAPA